MADLPGLVVDLTRAQQTALKAVLRVRTWPETLQGPWSNLCRAVSEESARRWRSAMAVQRDQRRLLWRLLRITTATYFVLGSDRATHLRFAHRFGLGLATGLRAAGLRGGGAARRPARGGLAGNDPSPPRRCRAHGERPCGDPLESRPLPRLSRSQGLPRHAPWSGARLQRARVRRRTLVTPVTPRSRPCPRGSGTPDGHMPRRRLRSRRPGRSTAPVR